MSEEWQQHWAGMHFFNPRATENWSKFIPGPKHQGKLSRLGEFCDRRLGKGVVCQKTGQNLSQSHRNVSMLMAFFYA